MNKQVQIDLPPVARVKTGGRVALSDSDELRRLWADGLSQRAIGEEMGVGEGAVATAARLYGLPVRKVSVTKRCSGTRPAQLARPDNSIPTSADLTDDEVLRRVARVTRAHDRGDLVAVPGFSPLRDQVLALGGGHYAALQKLAVDWGVSQARLLARWHRIRAVL